MDHDKRFSSISYVLLYASIVTICTIYTQDWPALLQIENAIYDPIQRITTINSAQQRRYIRIGDQLEEIVGINLDTAFVNIETDRINKKKAAQLLHHIAKYTSPKVVFFDYFFKQFNNTQKAFSEEDSLLIHQIQQLEDRIVLPYSVNMPQYETWKSVPLDSITIDNELVYKPINSGYGNNIKMTGDNVYRYHIPKTNDDTLHSSAYAMLKVLLNNETSLLDKNVPDIFEINFLINEIESNSIAPPLIRGINASEFIQIEEKELVDKLLRGKVVFISYFDRYKNKYGEQINQLKTPINTELSNVYLLMNIYLNLLTSSFFVRATIAIIFLVNFVLAWIGLIYFIKMIAHDSKPNLYIITEPFIGFILFAFLLFILYWYWHIKFPFVLTSFAFMRNQYFLNIFFRQTKKIY